MLIPRLFFGRANAPNLLKANTGFADDGVNYKLVGQTNRTAIAGIGGEVAFFMLYVTVKAEVNPTPLSFTVYIDDRPMIVKAVNVVGGATRPRTVLELSLMQPLPNTVPGYASRGLFALRGTWIQVLVETAFAGAGGFVQIDGIEVEHEIVREGKHEGANP